MSHVFRELSQAEIKALSERPRKYKNVREDKLPWLYLDPQACEAVNQGQTEFTAFSREWEVKPGRSGEIIYHEKGKAVPLGVVKLSRFNLGH